MKLTDARKHIAELRKSNPDVAEIVLTPDDYRELLSEFFVFLPNANKYVNVDPDGVESVTIDGVKFMRGFEAER